MNNTLLCVEGTLHFNEDVRTQYINIVMFKTGQQITINRSPIAAGRTLAEDISQQINNAEKILNNFKLIEMEEINNGDTFTDSIKVIYTFSPGPGTANRLWQVSYACQISEDKIINFTSVYPDEVSMENEINRLHHCVTNFKMNKI
ncbi:hypothetical protein SAMN05428971_4325 [Candidatus Pantoea varia]|uniref:DUF1795 domain-containing protein n=1 Tax=Candidatus Pantoea varia TaxID=1881036 RepID=A0A1I5HUE0_9GAMM|nr:DcrB-related protein [Pantoea varia]SFO51915.1 hypothetical protein SAMN05428971_4325 [Pantoea varia]